MSSQVKVDARPPVAPVREKGAKVRSARHLRVVRSTVAPQPAKPATFWHALLHVFDGGALATAASLPYSSLAQGSFGGY